MEYKSLPILTKEIGEDRVVKSLFSVMGHVDSVDDRILRGAYKKTLSEHYDRIKVLWQHNPNDPPIGVPLVLKEIGRDELPDDVKARFLEATGALYGEVKYLDTPRGNEVLTGIREGAITENSIGYDAIKNAVKQVGNVRELGELRLWDVSPVNWGAQEAALNVKGVSPYLIELVAMSREWAESPDALISGSAKMERLQKAISELNDILTAAEPPAEDPAIAETKARALTEQIRIQLEIAEAEFRLYSER